MGLLETLVRLINEVGLNVGAFGLCAWVVVKMVNKQTVLMDKLWQNMNIFCHQVKDEHRQSAEADERKMEQHRALMREHEQIIHRLETLNGRIV